MKPCSPEKVPAHLRVHAELAIAKEALRQIAKAERWTAQDKSRRARAALAEMEG